MGNSHSYEIQIYCMETRSWEPYIGDDGPDVNSFTSDEADDYIETHKDALRCRKMPHGTGAQSGEST